VTSADIAARARALARDPDVNVELAAGDLLEYAGSDEHALNEARDLLARELQDDPGEIGRRALDIVTAAADVGYGGE
jgi:hypothetical protein